MFNDLSSLASYLASRRSGRPREMIAPGPSDTQIEKIVEMAMRTPDHGKLAPWRVVSVGKDQRDRLVEGMTAAYLKETPGAGRLELEALDKISNEAPTLLIVLSTPDQSSKIPLWEQELSCGAFCMNLIHAVHATGFVGSWITGWPAFNDDVRDLFGKTPQKIAGFIFIGTASAELKERPRPELSQILSKWDG
ncbi:nitroreductase family protein [Parasphingorhabdus halotolerans]|uniref:Putative NAD(P)H nitroreductase n=1 Tax=Parasphingorhabdus halotolerans TaxID=2725558 RepID=A0A6H2DIS5_9SPHN|nr:nitroreductase [Parasphingorhabdus halotolerans]QJB68579.1 nitroreductase [Parasphingorhabdus halotolerans]